MEALYMQAKIKSIQIILSVNNSKTTRHNPP
jgi:hypothetical protein